MLVPSGRVVTAGAALAHLDLALWLLRQHSPAAASIVARYLMIDARPSQAAYIIADHLSHADPVIERFEQWSREHMAQGFSLTEAARVTLELLDDGSQLDRLGAGTEKREYLHHIPFALW